MPASLTSKSCTTKTHVNEALHRGVPLPFTFLACLLCPVQFSLLAIVYIRSVRRIDWCFPTGKQELPRVNSLGAHSCADHQPCIIFWVPVEISTMSVDIACIALRHRYFGVQISTFSWFIPLIHLDH